MSKKLKIYVAPVSGGSFPIQLAYLCDIIKFNQSLKV